MEHQKLLDLRAGIDALFEQFVESLTAPTKRKLSDLAPGDKFSFCGVTWVKLDDDDSGTLCLAADSVGTRAFDEDNCNAWSTSTLRNWLNTEFHESLYEAMPDDCEEDEPFIEFTSDLTADDGMKDYGTSEDYIALLSCDLYRKYRDIIPAVDVAHWTLTPWACLASDSSNVRRVNTSGALGSNNACSGNRGFRPLCKLKSNISVELVQDDDE